MISRRICSCSNYGFTHYAWKTYASDTLAGAHTQVLWGSPSRMPLGTLGELRRAGAR